MAYVAERAELALIELLEPQSTPQMIRLLHEFLRTKHITRPDGTILIDPRSISNQLLQHKRFPHAGKPSDTELLEAVTNYAYAPNPSADELEARYQRLMEHVKHPNSLSALKPGGPSDAAGYERLAGSLTRDLKPVADHQMPHHYSDLEIRMIARLCEQYTNLRERGNPWQSNNATPEAKENSLLSRNQNESDADYTQRRFYEAVNMLSRVYAGNVVRDINHNRIYRVKDAFMPEMLLFKICPNMLLHSPQELAAIMFARDKVTFGGAEARVDQLANAIEQYCNAFNQLHAFAYAQAENDPQKLAILHANEALRRELHSMMGLMERTGFSHAAASSALFTFVTRLCVASPDTLAGEFERAVAQASEKHNESLAALPENTVHEWLDEVRKLAPYVGHLTMQYPAQGVRADDIAPYPKVDASTIDHLRNLGYAEPTPGHHHD